MLAPAHPDWACCSEARRTPRTVPDARRGRTLLVGRSGAGSSWPATLRVVCGWLAVGVRQERNEGVGIRLVHPKKNLLAVSPVGQKRGPFPTLAQARRLDSYQGVCPIMPEQGDCRLRCAGYLNYPSRIPPGPIRRRPVPGPAGTGGALPPFPSLVSPTLCLPTAPSTQ